MRKAEDVKPTERYDRDRTSSHQSNHNSSSCGSSVGRPAGNRRVSGRNRSGASRSPARPDETKSSRGARASTLRYGEELGEYVITGFAGEGATSFVYRARPRHTFEPVAIKVLHPSMVAEPTRRKAFFKEARMMLQLDHDNVVEFHRILEEDGHVAFVMEYIDGVTLDTWLQRHRGSIDQATIAALFADILRGVRHAHDSGVIHRDLKPSNILISDGRDRLSGEGDGRASAHIIDFGVARGVDERPSRTDREKIRGTAAYMSPEEVQAPDEVCEASDLYSIGVMLYEAAAGTRPFESGDPFDVMRAHATREPASPRQFNPDLAPELEFVILKTLAKSPGRRFKNAREMISALELGIRGMQAQRRPESAGGPGESAVDLEQVVETTEWRRPDHLGADADPEEVERWHRQLLSWLGMVVTILTATGQTGGEHDPHFLSRGEDMSTRGGY